MRNIEITVLAVLMGVSISFSANVFSLYTDQRAVQQGDILTVMIVEDAQAGASTSTSTGKKNRYGVDNIKGSGALGFIPSFGASGELGAEYSGKGDTKRSRSFIAKVSARIDKVLDNGNLLITGNKVVKINQEQEIIELTGIVRPEDIEADNTVLSYNIADAKITYSGKGVNSDAQRAGPITRFFNWIF